MIGCVMHPCRNDGRYMVAVECACPGRRMMFRVCTKHAAMIRAGQAHLNCCDTTPRVTEVVTAGA